MNTTSFLKNSILVMMLFGLFSLPYVASNFIEYDNEIRNVLGVQSGFSKKEQKKEERDNKRETRIEDKNKSVDKFVNNQLSEKRVDLELVLNGDERQVFYDVLGGKYVDGDTIVTAVVSLEYEKQGFSVFSRKNGNKINLIVEPPKNYDSGKIDVTLILINAVDE